MISFELTDNVATEYLEIFLDKAGLAELCAQLALLSDGKSDHVNLMTESWGGSHLSEVPFGNGATNIKHVKITLL